MADSGVLDLCPGSGDALIVVDVQVDFLAAGSLPVADGDAVVGVINRYLSEWQRRGLPVVATRDWHPPDHCSFRPQGGPWPPHCVAGSRGAEFAPGLELPPSTLVISTATRPDREAYSGFEGTDLDQRLRKLAVRRVFVGGLATDYCVLNTVKDALGLGYAVVLLADAIRGVNVHPGDDRRAQEEMVRCGAVVARYETVIR